MRVKVRHILVTIAQDVDKIGIRGPTNVLILRSSQIRYKIDKEIRFTV